MATAAVVVCAEVGVGLPRPADAAEKPKAARELPALVSDRAPGGRPALVDGSFADAPGRDRPVRPPRPGRLAASPGAASGFDKDRSVVVGRTERSDVFANPDGSRTARVHPRAANFKDGSGSWRPIDTRVVADGPGFRNGGGPLDVRFAGRADSAGLVRVASGGTAATFSMVDAGPVVPSSTGSTLRYSGVAPGVDLEYEVGSSSVKELIVLSEAPASPTGASFRFRLNLDGLTPELNGDGSIALRDGAGEEKLVVPAATAWDSAVDPASAEPVYGPAKLDLARDGGGWVVTLSGDAGWLADPARRYPVYLDPTVAAGRDSGRDDASVTSRYPNNNYNVAWSSTLNRYEDKLGYYDATTGTNNTYLWYDLGFLDGADVTAATWNGYFIHSYYPTTSTRYRLRPSNCCWDAGGVTWNNKPAGRPELVDGMGVKNQWASSDVTGWVSNWTRGVWDNDGMVLDTAGDGTGSWKKLAAAENNDGSASYIQVTYNRPPDMAAAASAVPADGTVATLTPTLSVAPAADPDGNPVNYWFRVVTGADGETGTVVDSGWRSSPTWTVPAASLADGVAYTWRVYTQDGRVQTAPDWVRRLKVDLRVGARATNPTDGAGPVGVNLSNGNLSLTTATPSMTTAGGPVGLSFTYNSQVPATTGLTGSYSNDYNANQLFDDPVHLVRNDPQVNFNWGTSSPYPEAITGDSFLARWTGFVTVPTTGSYSFGAYQDNGVRIWVNNTLVVDRWTSEWGGPNYGSAVPLSAGVAVPIRVEYFEASGGAAVSLYAKGPVAETIVPSSWLSTAAPALPAGWSLSADLDGELAYTRAVLADASAVLTDASGATHTYAWNGAAYLPPAGEYGVLTKRADGGLTLAEDSGTTTVFDTSGHVASSTSGADDRGSPTYTWGGSPTRLQAIVDPVSGRAITLRYGGDPGCPSPAPPGFDPAAPAGMLCEARFPDATATRVWYSAGQLGRVEDPGGEVTDFAYTGGRLVKVRDPLAADVVAAGAAPDDDTTRTVIGYDGSGRAASVTLAAPAAGAPRPARSFRYVAAGETQVDVAGLAQPPGFARKVTFDGTGRTLTDTDAGSRTRTTTWNAADQPTSTTDPTGRRSTTIYDLNGKPVASYGPAPASWFNADGTPAAGRGPGAPEADQVPVTTTRHDEGTVGLSAEWWNTATPGGGPPVASSLAIGRHPDGSFYNLYAGAPAPGVNADGWSVRMTGILAFPTAGTFNVNPATMDGARLFLDGELFADGWTGSGGPSWTTPLRSVTVAAGERRRIVLEAHDVSGDELIQLGFPLADLSPNLGLVTSTVDPDGNTSAVAYANPNLGLASATIQDPGGLRLATTASYDTTRRRTARRLPANTYVTAVAADGPWGQWRLADRGWAAADSSGNNRNGAYYAADLYGGSRRGAAGALVGEDDPGFANAGGYGQVDLPADTIRGGPEGTVEAWIRPDAPGAVVGMVNATDASYVPVLYVGTDSLLRGSIWGFPQLTSPVGVVGNGWHHVALTFSATTLTLYVDGVAVGSAGGAANHLDMSRTYVGVAKTTGWTAVPPASPNGWTYYSGGIDEVAVYRSALPAARVQAHRAAGATDLSAATDAYYTATSDPIAAGAPCGGQAVVGLASRTSEVDPDGTGPQARMTRDSVYDVLGRVKGTRVNGGGWSCTTYDARGRATTQTYPAYGVAAARTVLTSWSADMLTTTTSDAAGTVTSRVDLLGRVVSSTDTWNKTSTTSFDQAGRAATSVGPNGTLTTGYRTDGLTATVSLDGTVVATPSWSPAGELDGVTYSNGVVGAFARDVLGREASTAWSGPGGTITTDAMARNRSGKIVNQVIDGVDPNPAGADFVYDPAGRLTDAWTPGRRQTYGFGTAGCGAAAAGRNTNRTAATDTAGPAVGYCYDAADRLTQVNGDGRYTGAIAYDDHGNTTALGGTTLGYDGADRHLRTVTGATTVEYLRDATDRITRRNLNGAVVAKYAHCGTGDNPCATLTNTGTVQERIIGLPGGATLTKTATGDTWALPNIHGDTVALTNTTGTKQGATRTYDPYGQTTGGGIPDTLTGNLDYGWLGQHQRPVETQAGLQTIEMGARQYLPGLGRFIEIDPVEGGSANDYDYVAGNPVNALDLDGRICWSCLVKKVSIWSSKNDHFVLRGGKPGFHWSGHKQRIEFDKKNGWHYNRPVGGRNAHDPVWKGLRDLVGRGVKNSFRNGWGALRAGGRFLGRSGRGFGRSPLIPWCTVELCVNRQRRQNQQMWA